VYVIFWPVSDLIARHDVGAITGRGYGAALQAAREAARGRLVAFGAGLFAAGALIYTARNFSLARQGQVTDRYTKAIEQLGSDKGLDVRIGGIYALERIARDSPRDHPTIMEVLAAFIRDHSSQKWPPPDVPDDKMLERVTPPDIQAAVTVIGRRNPKYDRLPVDLHSADLTGANLTRADLAAANFARANLTHATLNGANLTGANFTGADTPVTATPLIGAILRAADLAGANLTGAYLSGADLTITRLYDADFTGAFLAGAYLTGAYGHERATFAGADLAGVRWPTGEPAPKDWTIGDDWHLLKRED
jgi:hypothetical protein